MLHFQIKEQILKSGLSNPHTWLVKICGLSPTSATRLLNGKQQSLRLEHISKICVFLGCTPNDLLYWDYNEKKIHPTPQHPMRTQLNQLPSINHWDNILRYLDADDRNQMYEQAQQKLKDKGYYKPRIPQKNNANQQDLPAKNKDE